MHRLDRRRKFWMALAALLAATVLRPSAPAALEVALRADAGHALLRIGAASVSLAFDFGQECSKSNGCTGARL